MKYETTARRLREAMNDIGISQQELADKSGIGKSSISHYINGSNEPGNKSAYEIAKILNVNPAWLMGLDDNKHTDEQISDDNLKLIEKMKMYESIANDKEIISLGATKDQMFKAIDLFNKYQNATPEVQAAIEILLKQHQQ